MKRSVDRTNAARQRRYIQRLKSRETLEIERLKHEQKMLLLMIAALEWLIAEVKELNECPESAKLIP